LIKMRLPLILLLLLYVGGCAGPRSFSRVTPYPLTDAFACVSRELTEMEYELAIADTVGGLLQGHREITGLREATRRGAAAATEMITVGLAGGRRVRYDELTVFVYMRRYPQGNTIEVTAGMLTVADERSEQGSPTDAARQDARRVLDSCAPWG
jgi:hypothetical protein